MKKILLYFITPLSALQFSCYEPEDPEPVFVHKILNNSSYRLIVKIKKDNGKIDSIPIESMTGYIENSNNTAMFSFQDKQISFIFSDEKRLVYYYDSIQVQRINNPYYNIECESDFECAPDNTCTYIINNDDYQRANNFRF